MIDATRAFTELGVSEAGLGCALLALARAAIGERLGLTKLDEALCSSLRRPSATFVTLRLGGELRGCIGTIHPLRPLGVDVRENALAAAFSDPRFSPLTAEEFERTSIEVSLLSPAEALAGPGEVEVLAQLRPGVDGLTLEYGHRRATLLPQVWAVRPEARGFLAALKEKAGLAANFWSPAVRVSRFSVIKWT